MVMNLSAKQAAWVQSLDWEDPRRRAWQPTPVFLPGESHGQRSLVGCSPWGSQRVGHDGTTNTHTHRGSLEREEKRSITSPSIRDLIFSILLKYLPHLSHTMTMRGTVKYSFVLLRPVCCCGCNLP